MVMMVGGMRRREMYVYGERRGKTELDRPPPGNTQEPAESQQGQNGQRLPVEEQARGLGRNDEKVATQHRRLDF
jgi:hypothetical protein